MNRKTYNRTLFAVGGLITLAGGAFVYSRMPDESYKVTLDDGRIGTIRRWDEVNSLFLNDVGYEIIDSDGDFTADIVKIEHRDFNGLTDYRFKHVSDLDIQTFKEAI